MTTIRQAITSEIEAKQVAINKLSGELSALQTKLANADSEFQLFLEHDVEKVRSWFVSVADHLKNSVETT